MIAREEIFGNCAPRSSRTTPKRKPSRSRTTPTTALLGKRLGGDAGACDRGRPGQLRTGQVDVNGGYFNPLAPFGGYKQSGFRRERGAFGFEDYLEVKAIQR